MQRFIFFSKNTIAMSYLIFDDMMSKSVEDSTKV